MLVDLLILIWNGSNNYGKGGWMYSGFQGFSGNNNIYCFWMYGEF